MLLIIDDDKTVANMISDACNSIIANIVITKYISLLNVSVEELNTIKIILTDYNLDMNYTAEDVREYILEMGINCKIILMSGEIPSDDIISKYDGVLYKPFIISDLHNMINKLKD